MIKKREIWIDYLKAITIIMVIIGHCLDGYLKAGMFPESATAFSVMRCFIYSYHMPLFFVISGYTFSIAYTDARNELSTGKFVKQLLNLFLLYFIWAIVLWVIKMLTSSVVNTQYGITDLKRMFVVPLGNYWYLYVLTILYFLTGIFKTYKWNKLILFMATFIMAILSLGLHNAGVLHYTPHRVIYNLFFFSTGIVLCKNRNLIKNKAIFIIMSITACAIWEIAFFMKIDVTRIAITGPILALAMSMIFIYLISYMDNYKNKFLEKCGKNCIYIYIVHFYMTSGNRVFLPMIGITNAWLALIANTVITLVISYAVAVICEKLYITDIFFKPVAFFCRIYEKVKKK